MRLACPPGLWRIGCDPPLSACPSPKPARFDKLSLRTNAAATSRLWGVSPPAHAHPSSARWNRAQALVWAAQWTEGQGISGTADGQACVASM